MTSKTRAPLVLLTTAIAAMAMAGSPPGFTSSGSLASYPGDAADQSVPRVDGRYIVVYRPVVERPRDKTETLEEQIGFTADLKYADVLAGFAAELTQAEAREIATRPTVAVVVPDRPVTADTTVALATGDQIPTGVQRIGAANRSHVRQASSGGVAVLDTGIDLGHPDLRAANGTNCVSPGTPANDDNGHGTHVAGTIAARNDGAGVVGMAPGTQLYAVKVLDSSKRGSWSQIICGIDWVTGTRSDSDPHNDISVANMSLSGAAPAVDSCAAPGAVGEQLADALNDPLHQAICRATAAGVNFVVSAGNAQSAFDNPVAPTVPAAYPEVLTVAAVSDSDGKPGGGGGTPTCRSTEVDDRYASFSNYATTAAGQAHTIAAPGVCITSTVPGGGYKVMSGTSMAAPHVAGAIALCFGEDGGRGPCSAIDPADTIRRLREDAHGQTTTNASYGFTGDPTRPTDIYYFGYMSTAMQAAESTPPTVTSVSPAAGSTAVPRAPKITVTFSEPMDQIATEAAFSMTKDGDNVKISGTFSWSGETMTFTPSAPLQDGTVYAASVSGGTGSQPARDVAGNPLPTRKHWSFATATTVKASPASTEIQRGSGTLQSANSLHADDGRYYAVKSKDQGRQISWSAKFPGVSNALGALRVIYRGKSSEACAHQVSIWHWELRTWITLDRRSIGPTEVGIVAAPPGMLGNYVSGTSGDGELRIQLRCVRDSSGFVSESDLLKLLYTQPTS